MSTAELIYEKANGLSRPLQAEALRFVDYLLTREATEAEARDWAQFSSRQLAQHYSSADSVCDEDEGGT